jgi:hypothetical protein
MPSSAAARISWIIALLAMVRYGLNCEYPLRVITIIPSRRTPASASSHRAHAAQ